MPEKREPYPDETPVCQQGVFTTDLLTNLEFPKFLDERWRGSRDPLWQCECSIMGYVVP